jgi:hypothetical protein
MMEAATMPTVCLRFRFEEHPKIRALMEVCADIQQQTVDYALENGKGSSLPMIGGLGYTMWRIYYVEERRSEGEGEGWTVKPSGRFFSHVGRIAWNT